MFGRFAANSRYLVPVTCGVLVGVVGTIALELLTAKWLVVAALGLGGCLPALVVRDSTAYWLAVLVMSLPFEITKNLFDGFFQAQQTFESLGSPPYGATGFKLYLSDLPFLVLLAQWGARLAVGKATIRMPPGGGLILLWLVTITITSMLVAEYPKLSVLQLVRQYKYFVIYIFFVNVIPARKLLNILIILLMAVLAVEAVVAVARYQVGSADTAFGGFFGERDSDTIDTVISEDGDSGKIRSVGTFGHPAGAAIFQALLLPFPIVLFFFASTRPRRILYGGLAMVAVLGMAVTFSRSTMAAFVFGSGLVFTMVFLRGQVPYRLRALVVFAGISAIAVGTPLLYKYLSTRTQAAEYRLFLLEAAGRMVVDSPIVGVGLANSTALKPPFLIERELEDDEKYAIHNNHAVMLVETGLLGYALLVAVCLYFFRRAFLLTRSDDPLTRALAHAVLMAYCTAFIYMMGDNLAGNAHNSLMWIFCALIAILERRAQLPESERERDGDDLLPSVI